MSKSNKGSSKQNNLTFVRQVPKFLQHTVKYEPNIQDKFGNENEAEEKFEGEYNDLIADKEEERPQVIVLNDQKHLSESEVKKHYQKLGLIKKDEKAPALEKAAPEYETPPTDAQGRILFRTKRKEETTDASNSSEKVEEKTEKRKTSCKVKAQSKKAKKSNLLSFDFE